MKRIYLLFLAFLFTITGFSQDTKTVTESKTDAKYPKEVKLNWNNKTYDGPLPVDETFILIVHSDTVLPADLTLIRYISRNTFYYYEQPLTKIGGKDQENVPINKVTKHSITTTVQGTNTTTATIVENNGDPSKVMRYVRRHLVSPLRANFYYSVLDKAVYNEAKTKENVNEAVEEGIVANTYLNYLENNNRKVTAIIGVSYIEARTRAVRPYLGLRYNFVPINKTMQSRHYEEIHFEGSPFKKIFTRVSLDVGLSLASIEDSVHNQYDLFGKSNLLTGLGFRLGDGLFLSSGVLLYNKKDTSDTMRHKYIIKPASYISLSFDWDFSKTLDSFKKVLGAP